MRSRRDVETGAEGVRWDLGDLYSGIDDPRVEQDLGDSLDRARRFEQRYRGHINTPSITAVFLSDALRELEEIEEALGKVHTYAHLVFASDMGNPKCGALLQRVQEKITEVRKHLIFFELELAAIADEAMARLLTADNVLAHYKHFIEKQRSFKPHLLTEPEEKIMDEKSNTSTRAFSRLFDEVLGGIKFRVWVGGKPKEMTEAEVLALLYDPSRDVRRAAAKGLTKGLLEHSHVLTYIFNTLVLDHSINIRLRAYPHPMAPRNLSNEIDKATVDALVSSTEKGYPIVEDYYKLKRKLLGYRRFYDFDRYAPILSDKKTYDFNWSREVVLSSFGEFSPTMAEIAKEFFEKRWIDAEVRAGKRGGAFSHGAVPSVHPYVFMNYTGRVRDVMTLAHELGHAVHQYLSRKQGYFQCSTPLTMAETASVFGEMLVFHRLKELENDPKRKLSLLCSKLEDIFATVFRQIVLTRFEERLHTMRKERGELTRDDISSIWMEENSKMFGTSVELTEDYSLWWMYIPHFIHTPFYCYAYAFGELLVLALYRKYLSEGDSFVPSYLELLSAGGSDSPERLLGRIGVDIRDPNLWQTGLELIRTMVDEAVNLAEEIQ